jgi:hypothetical protein
VVVNRGVPGIVVDEFADAGVVSVIFSAEQVESVLGFISYLNGPNLTQRFTIHWLEWLYVALENVVTIQRYGRSRNQLHRSMHWVAVVRLSWPRQT